MEWCDAVLYLTTECFPRLEAGSKVNVRAGGRESVARVVRGNVAPGEKYALSLALAQSLCLPLGVSLRLRLVEAGLVRIGPVIGILTGSVCSGQPLKGTQAELAYLSQQGSKIGALVYVFTPQGIDWEEGVVRGYFYSQELCEWMQSNYPLPDVVYDQFYVRGLERKYQSDCQRLKQVTGNRYFNSRYFNKLEIHRILSQSQLWCGYLPATRRLHQSQDLAEAISVYGSVYLKPSGGSLGEGIMQVKRVPGGYYYQDWSGQLRGVVATVAEVYATLQQVKKGSVYLVQQDLKLASYQNRIFDIRVLIQKDGTGQWCITKLFTRLAPEGAITANLATGGTACSAGKILRAVAPNGQAANATSNAIKKMALKLVAYLEQATSLQIGELGLDVGIDRNGKIWIIEVNSKPRRTTETLGSTKQVELSFLRPLSYACYLAGF